MTYQNEGSVPIGWKDLLEKNLRLPPGYNDDLVNHCLISAIHYVERHTGRCMIGKTVQQIYTNSAKTCYLVFKPSEIVHVKQDGEELVADVDYKVYNSTHPSFVKLTAPCENNVIEIEYDVTASNIRDDIKNVVIMHASHIFNNPEGIPQMDMNRINHYIRSLG